MTVSDSEMVRWARGVELRSARFSGSFPVTRDDASPTDKLPLIGAAATESDSDMGRDPVRRVEFHRLDCLVRQARTG